MRFSLFKKELKGQEALIQGLAENPLPDSYEVTFDRRSVDSERLEVLAGKFSEYRGVEDVSYGKEGARVLSGFYKAITYGGMTLAVLLGVTVVFIISNSVRLALILPGAGDRADAVDRGDPGIHPGAVPH